MSSTVEENDLPEPGMEALLRAVGRRSTPAAQMTSGVYDAVHAEWLDVVLRRQHRGHLLGYAVAAGIACLVVAVIVGLKFFTTDPVPSASIERIDGTLLVSHAGRGEWSAARIGAGVSTGDKVRAVDGSRAAFAFGEGVSVRLDAGSVMEIASPERVVLVHGSVYVDANPHAPAGRLVVTTPFGSVRHLGTQYLVNLSHDEMLVSVREGEIELSRDSGTLIAHSGEGLLVSSAGAASVTTVQPSDSRWQWATAIAPGFSIDHQSLTAFLAWVARETGKQVTYSNRAAEAQAAAVILRGSTSDLAPEQALRAVLATTSLKCVESGTTIEIYGARQAGGG